MGVSDEQLQRIVAQADLRERQGYFEVVRGGDQRAASLWARLLANDLNPTGKSTDVGWLSKLHGGANVDGWAEDAICGNAHPGDLENVIDLVGGAGLPGARPIADVKPRRPTDEWVKPKPLTAEEMTYLLAGGLPVPIPPQEPVQPYPSESPDGGWWGQVADVQIAATYARKNRPYPSDQKSLRWVGRIAYDIRDGLTKEGSLDKHIKELEQELGL